MPARIFSFKCPDSLIVHDGTQLPYLGLIMARVRADKGACRVHQIEHHTSRVLIEWDAYLPARVGDVIECVHRGPFLLSLRWGTVAVSSMSPQVPRDLTLKL